MAERRRRLLQQVRDRGYVSFRELAEALETSESTVRRDLRSMVAEGLLTATRGGVGPAGAPVRSATAGPTAPVAAASDDEPDPVHRHAIAACAAGLVVPGSAVLLGPGRTTTAL